MSWRELLDTYAAAVDRLFGPLTDDPLPSPERAKPETPQATGCLSHYEDCPDTCPWRTPFQPITSPGGSQAWKARMLAARREALANRIDQGIADALADATETITNPYGQEATMPEHTTAARDAMQRAEDKHLADLVRGVRDAEGPGHTTQIDGVKIAKCDTHGRTHEESTEYQRGLAEGLDNRVVDAEVIGSPAWLRDLADRLQQYLADRGCDDTDMASPLGIRWWADGVERDERQAAADTRDRARVEPILAARWAKDRDRQFLPSLVPTWDDLSDEERAHCIDYGLELYRAGRDDQENDRG